MNNIKMNIKIQFTQNLEDIFYGSILICYWFYFTYLFWLVLGYFLSFLVKFYKLFSIAISKKIK